jgi:Tfp pilus assembly protein PilZ
MPSPIVDRRARLRREGRRRRYPRVRLAFEGFYSSAERMLFTSSGNLSLRGVYLPTPAPDAVGTPATLRLGLPGRAVMLKIPARVVWSNSEGRYGPVGMGVRFEGALPWQLKRMAAVLIRKAGLRALS